MKIIAVISVALLIFPLCVFGQALPNDQTLVQLQPTKPFDSFVLLSLNVLDYSRCKCWDLTPLDSTQFLNTVSITEVARLLGWRASYSAEFGEAKNVDEKYYLAIEYRILRPGEKLQFERKPCQNIYTTRCRCI